MSRNAFAYFFGELSVVCRHDLAKPATAIVLAAICADVGTAHAQQRKKRPDAYHLVIVEYKGPDTAEVLVTDTKQDHKDILRKIMRRGEEIRIRALATVTRTTQDQPEIQLRWKVSGPFDDKGAPPRSADARKPTTWCGDVQGSDRRTKIQVGFQSDGIRGRGC